MQRINSTFIYRHFVVPIQLLMTDLHDFSGARLQIFDEHFPAKLRQEVWERLLTELNDKQLNEIAKIKDKKK